MSKYRVHLVTTASCSIEVEAESGEEAIEAAYEKGLPYADAFAGFDIGEWVTPSDFDSTSDPEDDWEEID